MNDLFNTELPKGRVWVSIYPSNLRDKDGNKLGKCVGKIKKNTVSMEQLAAQAEDTGHLLSKETLLYAARILSSAAKKSLEQGNSVDLLGLGTLGFSVQGSVDKTMTVSEIAEHFALSFTPSKEAEHALKNITPSRIIVQDSRIYISEVKSFNEEGWQTNIIYTSRTFCIYGNGLKTGGEINGVFLVPYIEQNVYAPRSEWIALPAPFTNTPKKLELFLPDTFNLGYDGEEGEKEPLFCIAVVTSLNPNSRERAECVEAFSQPVKIRRR